MIYTLHGWSYDGRVWKGTPFERAVHLELPGHGESPFNSTDLWELAAEVGESIEEGSTLVGWSLGATVSILVALNYPEKVRELILYAPTPSFTGTSQPEAVVRRFLRRLKRDFYEGVEFFRELSSTKNAPLPQLNPKACTELLESFTEIDCTEELWKLKVPVKVIVGEDDAITGLIGAYSVFKGAPLSQLKVIPKADHLTVLKYAI